VSLTGLKSFNTNIYEKVLYISYFSTKKSGSKFYENIEVTDCR